MENISERIARLSLEKLDLLARRLERKQAVKNVGQVITKRHNHNSPAPLSFDQQRLWFLNQLDPDSPAYNTPVATRFSSELDIKILEKSVNEVVRRHEILRTIFLVSEGQPQQVVIPELKIPLQEVDLTGVQTDKREAEAIQLAIQTARLPFKLSQGPLLRVSVFKLEEREYLILYVMHHVITDGPSCQIFNHEITALYWAFLAGEPAPLSDLPIQYADFAVWQRKRLTEDVIGQQLSFWKDQLAGAQTALELRKTGRQSCATSPRAASHAFAVHHQLYDSIKRRASQERATLFTVLLTAFAIVLRQYYGQDDIAIGTDVNNRDYAETEGLIGFFVNQIIIRANVNDDLTFRDLLAQIRHTFLRAYVHKDLPFDLLVKAINPDRGLDHSPLFQIKMALQQVQRTSTETTTRFYKSLEIATGATQLDLILNMVDDGATLVGAWEYNSDFLNSSAVSRLAQNFKTVLQQAVVNADAQLIELMAVMTKAEEEREKIEIERLKEVRLRKIQAIKRR